MNFTKTDYYQEKFSKLSFSNEGIELIEFEECDFVGCTFIDCEFKKCKFLNCKFINCLLSAVKFSSSSVIEVSFTQCKVIGIDWTKSQQVRDLQFDECEINYSNFVLLKIPKTKIVNCIAKDVDFTETDLHESDLRKTNFENSIFYRTNLSKTDLRGANNYFIDVKNNTISRAKFSLPEALSLLQILNIVIENS